MTLRDLEHYQFFFTGFFFFLINVWLLNYFSLNGNFVLELDFEPFTASFPKPTLSKSIGNGVEFLNRHLSAKLFHDKESMLPLLEFLRVHCHKGKVCMWLPFFSLICFSLLW